MVEYGQGIANNACSGCQRAKEMNLPPQKPLTPQKDRTVFGVESVTLSCNGQLNHFTKIEKAYWHTNYIETVGECVDLGFETIFENAGADMTSYQIGKTGGNVITMAIGVHGLASGLSQLPNTLKSLLIPSAPSISMTSGGALAYAQSASTVMVPAAASVSSIASSSTILFAGVNSYKNDSVAGAGDSSDGETVPEIIGKPHGTAAHQEFINSKVNELAESGNYSEIFVNRSLNTSGFAGTQRPDIIAVGKDGVVIFEIASPGQMSGTAQATLVSKFRLMLQSNPEITGELIYPSY